MAGQLDSDAVALFCVCDVLGWPALVLFVLQAAKYKNSKRRGGLGNLTAPVAALAAPLLSSDMCIS